MLPIFSTMVLFVYGHYSEVSQLDWELIYWCLKTVHVSLLRFPPCITCSVFAHRQRSLSCSSSWPPKTPRSNVCRTNCWPEAAQPMTTQREVHTPDQSCHICVHLRDSDMHVSQLQSTSNQHVALSSAVNWFVLYSLLPSAVEEVYIKQLIDKCKA